MNFLDLPHDVLRLIANRVDSLASFRLVHRRMAEIQQKSPPDPVHFLGGGSGITEFEENFLRSADPDTLIIFKHFSRFTLEYVRPFLPRFNRLHFHFYESTNWAVSTLIPDTLNLLSDLAELGVCEVPAAEAGITSHFRKAQVGNERVFEAVMAVLQRSEQTLRSVTFSHPALSPQTLLACGARCANLTSIEMPDAKVELDDDETEALVAELLRSHPNLLHFDMKLDSVQYPDVCARIIAEQLVHCPNLPLGPRFKFTPGVIGALLPLLPPDRSFPSVTALSVSNSGKHRTSWPNHLPQLQALFPAVQQLTECIGHGVSPLTLSVSEWRAIESRWPQLRRVEAHRTQLLAHLPDLPELSSRLEQCSACSTGCDLSEWCRIGPLLANLRELVLNYVCYNDRVVTTDERCIASAAAQSLSCAPVLRKLDLHLPHSMLPEFIWHLPSLPALTCLKLTHGTLWSPSAFDELWSAVDQLSFQMVAGTVRRRDFERVRALKDACILALHRDSQICASTTVLPRVLALCPSLVELHCTLLPQDLTEIGTGCAAAAFPNHTLRTLRITVESIGPLVNSGLLRGFPSLRQLTLEVLLFDPIHMLVLTAQCQHLVHLTVQVMRPGVSICQPVPLVIITALVGYLPRLRTLTLQLPVENPLLTEAGPDHTLGAAAGAARVLAPAARQLISLGLDVAHAVRTPLRKLAPGCALPETLTEIPCESRSREWWRVEQALRRSEQAEKRAREGDTDTEAAQRTRVKTE